MKRISSVISLLIISTLLSFAGNGNDCNIYYPVKAGASRTYTQYDKKDKVTGTSTQTVLAVNQIKGGVEIIMGVSVESPGSDTAINTQFTATCQDGVYAVSMDNFLDQALLSGYEGMEMEVDTDNIDLPVNPVAGQKLKDGSITVRVISGGITIITLSVNITNRMVAAIEDVTTDAGTYKCTKITYDVESKVGFIRIKSQAAEWYAKDIGMVKSETYDKKGKLESYSLLTAVN